MKKILLLGISFLLLQSASAQIQTLQKLSQITFNTSCAGVWHYVDGSGNEYALLGNGDGIVIVDVTDPVNPVVLFTVPAANSLWREIKTYSHYAYAGTEGGGGITIIDLSGLPGSYISKIYDGDGAIAGQLGASHTVQVFDDHLYVFGTAIGTVMCSLADPWNPQYVGSYTANYVHDGYVLNDTLYSSEIYAGQFSVVDVTDKANPVVLATQATPGLFNHNGWFSDNRQYFYTTDELNNTPLGIFDVSDINDIQLVGTYYNDSLPDKEIHNVRVINDYLINPSYGAQLTIVDGARPLNLIEIARHPTGPYLCWDAVPYLPSGNIIATDMSGEFYVFAPYYVRACYLEGNVTDQSNGNPINGATVKILSTTVTKNSDLLGDYRTGYPTAGTFDVEFSKPGYITKVINNVVLSNGILTVLDVQLEPFSFMIDVVDNANGTGVPFAQIRIQNANTDVTVTTDANGQITLNTVASANYEVTAGKWGYKTNCVQFIAPGSGVLTIPVDQRIYDDFTFDYGWTSSGTASSGLWVRGEPAGTLFGATPANPDFDSNNDCSDQCFVTGNGGGNANFDDVDDGTAVLVSPVLDLTGMNDPYLNYERWFYQQFTSNTAAHDTMFVFISNGVTTVEVDVITGPSPSNSTWVPNSVRILDHIGLSSNMTVIVLISDKPGTGNPLEGGFDKFEISEGPTGIFQPDNNSASMVIYPNPFSNKFEVELSGFTFVDGMTMVISDITGRVIEKIKVNSTGKTGVDGSRWHRGIYFAQIEGEKMNHKVVKIVKY